MSLAAQANSIPLPAVSEVFGVRLPPEPLTSVDFDLIPHKPPPGVKLYDEEIEEVDDSDSEDEDEDMEPAPIPLLNSGSAAPPPPVAGPVQMPVTAGAPAEDGSDAGEDEDGLFAGADDEEEEEEEESAADDLVEDAQPSMAPVNGLKRKLVEDDEYD